MTEPTTTTALVPTYAMNPATGERVELDQPADQLAAAIDEAKEMKSKLDEFTGELGKRLIVGMDRNARWTHHVGQYKVSAPSPDKVREYDAAKLAEVIAELLAAELIDVEAANRAIKMEPKVMVAGVTALEKISPEVKAKIADCYTMVDPKRRVTVKLERPE